MEEDQGLRDIYQSTYAVIFFGTPHRGSSYANLGVLARDIAVAAGFNATDVLVRSLKPEADMLTILRTEFARMLHDEAFKIHSFQEGQGFTGFSAASRKVRRLTRVLLACSVLIWVSRLLTMSLPGWKMLGRDMILLMPTI